MHSEIKRCARQLLSVVSVAAALYAPARSQAAPPLAGYNVDPATVTVSGLSGGAFFAMQLGIAFSSTFHGVGVVAGGPYNCYAHYDTMSGCMYNSWTSDKQAALVTDINNFSASGAIDDKSNIPNQRWISMIGTQDTIIGSSVQGGVESLLTAVGLPSANLRIERVANHNHHWSVDYNGDRIDACGTAQLTGHISDNCNFDESKAVLNWVYPGVTWNSKNTSPDFTNNLVSFDQTEYNGGIGMDSTGWLYVPANCKSGAACKLHVVLHSCTRSYDEGGNEYMETTEYVQWADTNGIILLFPQAHNTGSYPQGNNACFDFMHFYGSDFAQKTGVEMQAVKKMVDRVLTGFTGGSPPPPPSGVPSVPTGLTVTSTTSSSVALSWTASSEATSYNVYRNGGATPVGSPTTNTFTDTGLAANTTYSYQVSAVNSYGESAKSSSVNATTQAPVVCYTDTNTNHVAAGRAHYYPCAASEACANGSNQDIGPYVATSTLRQTGPNYWVLGCIE